MLLTSPRNAKQLPYSHWGGTDHEELRDSRQRRGSGSSILRKNHCRSLSLPTRDLPSCAPVHRSCPNKLRERTCHGRLFWRVRFCISEQRAIGCDADITQKLEDWKGEAKDDRRRTMIYAVTSCGLRWC